MRHAASFPTLRSRAVLSPMAGVTDVAFRALAASYGAGMTYTEFVSSAAIVRGNTTSLRMIRTDPQEQPVAIQLFGANVQEVVAAAVAVEDRFDVIDINCGCPAWKVIKTGAGSALLKDPQRIATFVNKLTSAVRRPVTVKIRKGIDDAHINACDVARAIEDAGAAAIAIHGRTQKQGYSGRADWDCIRQVKETVSIPVIGNGDVFTVHDFANRLQESGVDAIMLARGAMGNPAIFSQIASYERTGSFTDALGVSKRAQFAAYLPFAQTYGIPLLQVRNHAVLMTKGLPGATQLREQLMQATDPAAMLALFADDAAQDFS